MPASLTKVAHNDIAGVRSYTHRKCDYTSKINLKLPVTADHSVEESFKKHSHLRITVLYIILFTLFQIGLITYYLYM